MLSFSGQRSAAAGRLARKHLLGEIKTASDRRLKADIQSIRLEIDQIREGERHDLRAARANCAVREKSVRVKSGAEYKRDVLAARAKARAKRDDAVRADRAVCAQEKRAVVASAQEKIRGAHERIVSMRNDASIVRRAEARAERKNRSRATRAERLREADDKVTVNLDDALIPVWNRVRGQIKGTSAKSRLEAFEQWVEEHPDEVLAARERYAEQQLARDMAEYHGGADRGDRPARGPGLQRARGTSRLKRAAGDDFSVF